MAFNHSSKRVRDASLDHEPNPRPCASAATPALSSGHSTTKETLTAQNLAYEEFQNLDTAAQRRQFMAIHEALF
jgi:hypothetical protein